MPKILINEQDKTKPGSPGEYGNYSVLLVGFAGKTPDQLVAEANNKASTTVKPDTNGVYEFSSAGSFLSTIGAQKVAVEIKPDPNSETGVTIEHYGNHMAYELLNMGYKVIYKPITSITEIDDEAFWDIFKDKASYDFRFISHGLLSSTIDLYKQEDYAELLESIEEATVRKKAVDTAKQELGFIIISSTNPETGEAYTEAEIANLQNTEYNEIKDNYAGFKDTNTGKAYKDYDAAVAGVDQEIKQLDNKLADLNNQKKALDAKGISRDAITRVNGYIANVAAYIAASDDEPTTGLPGRGDCLALVELDDTIYLNDINTEEAILGVRPEQAIIHGIGSMLGNVTNATVGKYCALTVPSVVYAMSDDNAFKNNKFPGSFHYLACFMNSLQSGFAEWYAAAGYTRGTCGLAIDYTTVKLGEVAINALEPRKSGANSATCACNVIANFRGSYYLWGNRTMHTLGTELVASHFLNIRHLCTTIKKQLYVACRRFTFDPNSDTLWFNFVNAIKPTLDKMKADQGVRDYQILKEFTDKKATLKAKIRIIPIEAVEDFDLTITLEDSFGETSAAVAE